MTLLGTAPTVLSGKLRLPPSKSQTLRAVLFASLAKGVSFIHEPLSSPDVEAMIKAMENLGAKFQRELGFLRVQGTENFIQTPPTSDNIWCGNSGIVLRFVCAVAALSPFSFLFDGDASLRKRPMIHLLSALEKLGVKVEYLHEKGFAPFRIQGPVKGTRTSLQGHDSQAVSALLFAAAQRQKELHIEVENPGELPWIDLSLDWLEKQNVQVEHVSYEKYKLLPASGFSPFEYRVPGDLSSLAFPLIAAVITKSSITIENVDLFDLQGDKRIVSIIEKMGGNLYWDEEKMELNVLPSDSLKGLEVDINSCIDAVPALAVLACFADSPTKIYNARVAAEKECNRLKVMAKELGKMGAKIQAYEDALVIFPSRLHAAELDSHHDHRVAMALSVAGLTCEGKNSINDISCIEKTYPSFYNDMKNLGAQF